MQTKVHHYYLVVVNMIVAASITLTETHVSRAPSNEAIVIYNEYNRLQDKGQRDWLGPRAVCLRGKESSDLKAERREEGSSANFITTIDSDDIYISFKLPGKHILYVSKL